MGPTKQQERECDDMAKRGEHLRAAVAWRVYQGKGEILSAMTGVSVATLRAFVKTGELDATTRSILEMSAKG